MNSNLQTEDKHVDYTENPTSAQSGIENHPAHK